MRTSKKTLGTGTKFSAVRTTFGSMVRTDLDNLFSVNNFLINVVVNPSHPTVFSPRDLLQKSFTGASAFRLEFSSQTLEHKFLPFNLFGIKKSLVGSNCNVVYSDIHPKKSVKKFWSRNVSGNNNMQKQSLVINQVSRTNFPIKIFPIVFRNFNRKLYSSMNSAKRNIIINLIRFKSKTSCIIPDCKVFFHNRLAFRFSLKDFNSLVSATANQLSRKLGFFSNIIISQIMQLPLIIGLDIPPKINNFVSRIRILLHSFNKFISVRQFNFYDGFHKRINVFNTYIAYGGKSRTVASYGVST